MSTYALCMFLARTMNILKFRFGFRVFEYFVSCNILNYLYSYVHSLPKYTLELIGVLPQYILSTMYTSMKTNVILVSMWIDQTKVHYNL